MAQVFAKKGLKERPWRSSWKAERCAPQPAWSKGYMMKIRFAVRAAIILTAAGMLSACVTNRPGDDARLEYERSVADYENCLAANQMSTCEGERRIMRANKRALSAIEKRPSR